MKGFWEKSPAGGQAGHAVFLSVCNTAERASVFCGTGPDLLSAWKHADAQVMAFLENSNFDPVWVKADVVFFSDTLEEEEFIQKILAARHEFYRYGVAFDKHFQTALLEALKARVGKYLQGREQEGGKAKWIMSK